MCEPRYIGLQASDLPQSETGGARVTAISGRWGDVRGPVESQTDVSMSVVDLRAGARLACEGVAGRTVFLYVVRGDVRVQGAPAGAFSLVELDRDGARFVVEAQTPATLLLGHAAPLNEPMVAHGPFVMTTQDEIRTAYEDYRAGRFGGLTLPAC